MLLAPLASPTPATELGLAIGCPASALGVPAGAVIQRLVAAAPEGAAFCIRAGEHRGQAIIPKDRQRFYGEAGAVLNGSRLITRFSRQGGLWVAEAKGQLGRHTPSDVCLPAWPRCADPEAVFLDDQPLRHVASRTSVTAGTFFFDYPTGRVYIADDPTGKRFEVSVLPFAFSGAARQVLIQGLTVEKYASALQHGAVGYNQAPVGWVLRGNTIRLNHGAGVDIGAGSQVIGNRIERNGQLGIGCTGPNVFVEHNEIAWNGYFSGARPNWEAGGAKCTESVGLVVRANHLHNNNGPGFWTDINNVHTLYEANLVEYNRTAGLSHEISYDAVIRDNTLRGNGMASEFWLWGGAIQIQNSRGVEVHNNIVDTTEGGNGICLIQQDRGMGRHGAWVTTDNRVHDNLIISRRPDRGISGAIADQDPAGMWAGNNRFYDNRYQILNEQGRHWAWVDGFFGWAEYRRRSGQDAGSTIELVPPATGHKPP